LIQELNDPEKKYGLLTPWNNVNPLIKGFRPGDLVIVSAPPKTGKTSFTLNMSTALAFQQVPSLFFCLEMRPERLVKKVIQSKYRKEDLTSEDLKRATHEFAGLPLYFGYSFKKQSLEDILNQIREGIKRYDLKLVVFDNLHFLIRSVTNVNEELGQAVQGFKLLAEEMEIPVIAIAQPRKRETKAKDEIMSADDIKYSNAIHADCDQMIILYRKRLASTAKEIGGLMTTLKEESLDPVTLVRIEAHRYGSGGEALLYFHGDYSRFDLIENSRR
jgi:replicative DNA helicase